MEILPIQVYGIQKVINKEKISFHLLNLIVDSVGNGAGIIGQELPLEIGVLMIIC